MRNLRLWFFGKKAYARFLIMFTLVFGISVIIMLVVNALSNEPWYRGILGSIITAAVFSAWSLSDKKFYEQTQKKHDQKN